MRRHAGLISRRGHRRRDGIRNRAMSKLEAVEISKKFRRREVVNSVSLTVESGEVAGLLGPNGAGKTTAFYMIVGLVRCDRGRIILNGQDVTRLPVHRRAPFPDHSGSAPRPTDCRRGHWQRLTSGTRIRRSTTEILPRLLQAGAFRTKHVNLGARSLVTKGIHNP